MSRMGKLSNKHGCRSVLETQTETNDGTCNRKHDESVGERLQKHPDDYDHRADDYSVLPPNLLNQPPEEELRGNTAEALRAVEDAKFGAGGIVEVPESVSPQALKHERWCRRTCSSKSMSAFRS